MSEENPWKTLDSKLIYKNPWIKVREDQVICPDGSPGIYGVVDTRIATGVVALTDDMQVYLVGQYRYPTDVYSWEIPEGGAENDESALETAKRELKEEAGVIATSWEPLGGELHLSNCISSERGYVFLARGLEECGNSPDHTEVLKVKKVPFSDALLMVERGEITDCISMVALLLASRVLSK